MKKGKVILVGAGPGDPELITIKAVEYLKRADVIITDRLASPELISRYASLNARVIYAGKEGASASSLTQTEVNELILEHFDPNKIVLRLKGGDVAFYANVLDELRVLKEHNIPFEIVPGITAASGASAYAGIPLTARGLSRGVRLLTFHQSHQWNAACWRELARTEDTLVFYMSSQQLSHIAERLLQQGASPHKPLAVIEQATTPYQQVHKMRLSDAESIEARYVSPSILIVGEVVNLHEQFHWFYPESVGNYFDPVVHLVS